VRTEGVGRIINQFYICNLAACFITSCPPLHIVSVEAILMTYIGGSL